MRREHPLGIAVTFHYLEAPEFKLDLDGKEIKVRAGEPLDIVMPFFAAPAAEVTWAREGKKLADDGIDTVITGDGESFTRLLLPVSKRGDSGMYQLKAVNELGEAKANIKVTVIDKPGEPEGPLTYPATTKRSVTLAWEAPKDTGGEPILGYVIEYQEVGAVQRGWEKVPESVHMLSHTVKGLDEGKQYVFRVRAENIVGVGAPLTGAPVTAKDPFGGCFYLSISFYRSPRPARLPRRAQSGQRQCAPRVDAADGEWRQSDHRLHRRAIREEGRWRLGAGEHRVRVGHRVRHSQSVRGRDVSVPSASRERRRTGHAVQVDRAGHVSTVHQ